MNELLGQWPGIPLLDISIMLLLTALGLRSRPVDTLMLIRNPLLGVRAVLAMFVFVPACTLLMTWSLPLEPAIRASLLAMSVAPLCPTNFRAAAETDGDYMLGLQFFAAVVSLAAVPAMMAVAERIYDFETHYPIGRIAFIILKQIGLPLTFGMGLTFLLGDKSKRVALWLERIGYIAMITAMALILYFILPKVWYMSVNGRLLSVVAFTGFVLLGGHLFGGPDRGSRDNLIMGSVQRHPVISLLIATTVVPAEEATMMIVIVMFILLGNLAMIPYMLKRDGDAVG